MCVCMVKARELFFFSPRRGRMLFALITVTASVFIVTLLTPPEPMEGLKKFLLMARPFPMGWKPVIRELGEPYDPVESFGRTMLSWAIGLVMVMVIFMVVISIPK